jgi:hypothetical protein
MKEITISKKEYQELLEKALRYDYFRRLMEEDIFAPPPTKSIREVLRAFEKTKIYSPKFLKSLERGLKRSSYFRK